MVRITTTIETWPSLPAGDLSIAGTERALVDRLLKVAATPSMWIYECEPVGTKPIN
jgi:hypothetical protein